jgi:hypothetical protein
MAQSRQRRGRGSSDERLFGGASGLSTGPTSHALQREFATRASSPSGIGDSCFSNSEVSPPQGEATQIDWQDAKVGLHWSFTHHEDRNMPIRIASMTHRIAKNGAMLHKATMDRVRSLGADHEPSEAEQALAEERRLLKEERAKRQARAQQPRAKAIDKLVRTHHPQAKEKPKEKKEPKEAKASKAHRPSRAEKHAAQAAALQAASRAPKKTPKT